MSDIRLFKTTTNKLLKKQAIDRAFMQEVIEKNAKELLGLTVIGSNIAITDKLHEKIDTLCYDEDYCLVIVEYRIGKFSQTIQKGIMFLDYIEQNHAKVKALLAEIVGRETAKAIRIQPRLISIGEDFNEYDGYAIRQLRAEIDLIKVVKYESSYIALEKIYQSKRRMEGTFANNKSKEDMGIIEELCRFALELGDEVIVKESDGYISFRKICHFAYIIDSEGLILQTKDKDGYLATKIRSKKDVEVAKTRLEKAYDAG